MSQAWFLYIDNVVSGPFNTDQVKSKIREENLKAKCFIWWKGQREWIPVSTWEKDLDAILEASATAKKKPIWYVDVGGTKPAGPLTQNEMIEMIKSAREIDRIRLWAIGMKQWQSIFELHDVMEMVGISRRETARAPLMGSVAINRTGEDPKGFVVKAASISVAGLGVAEAFDLRRGDQVSLLVKSSDLKGQIHVRGEVVYVTPTGYAGIRFHQIHPESQSIIHDYVKRFTVESEKNKSAA